jgi:hypothetical protein
MEKTRLPLNKLKLARNFAIDHKYSPTKLYKGIITGKLNAYVAGHYVFINTEDPSVIDFIKNSKPEGEGHQPNCLLQEV